MIIKRLCGSDYTRKLEVGIDGADPKRATQAGGRGQWPVAGVGVGGKEVGWAGLVDRVGKRDTSNLPKLPNLC